MSIRITTTNDFAEWAKNDETVEWLEIATEWASDFDLRQWSRGLKSRGEVSEYNRGRLISASKRKYGSGWASFKQIRILEYYWRNGDKIIFPINSQNQVYLGNDDNSWCQYWPFLRQTKESREYICTLSIEKSETSTDYPNRTLIIAGQSHFGHFVYNRYLGLSESIRRFHYIGKTLSIAVPPDYSNIIVDILSEIFPDLEQIHTLSGRNGIRKLHNVSIPAIDPSPHVYDRCSFLGKEHVSTNNRKGVYLTRGLAGSNDRIIDYSTFEQAVKKAGYDIVNPMELNHQERKEIIGSYAKILSDMGSCGYNAFLYRRSGCHIQQMIPRNSLIEPMSDGVLSQVSSEVKLGAMGGWIPVDVAGNVDADNHWHGIYKAPSLERLVL